MESTNYGVPSTPLQVGSGIFLSYSGVDDTFAAHLHQALLDAGYSDLLNFDAEFLSENGISTTDNILWEAGSARLGVVVLSEEYFARTTTPMRELSELVKNRVPIFPLFYRLKAADVNDKHRQEQWEKKWKNWVAMGYITEDVIREWRMAVHLVGGINGLECHKVATSELQYIDKVVEAICKIAPPAALFKHQIEARRLAAKEKAALRELSKVPATAVRLFICGDGYAGKTTLLSTLSSLCVHKPRHGYAGISSLVSKLSSVLLSILSSLVLLILSSLGLHKPQGTGDSNSQNVERTRGIQVHALERDGIQISTWDLAGQTEFHAFHDHMIPDSSNSPALFLFLWSPLDSVDEHGGNVKNQEAFNDSFHYWLRFVAAKSPPNILRKIIVVLTRQDQTTLVLQALKGSIEALKTRFGQIFQVVEVFHVDARSPTSVQPLLSCIFETAKDVLESTEIYDICAQVSEYLATQPTIKDHGPIMPWASFCEICANKFKVIDPKIHKAIAYSLNESGSLIYLSHLPFLVLDPNWFCNVVMGSLIYFPHSPDITSKAYIPIGGFGSPSYLEDILKEITQNRVEVRLLMDLLEAMHVFCRVPGDGDGDDGKVFIPYTLFNINTSERPLQWRQASDKSFAYAGRRLQCDRKDLTFLTPGFFHRIQVLFSKAFLETNNSRRVQLGKGFIFICLEDLQIIVEWCLEKKEHVIDVMVRAPHKRDIEGILVDVENNIFKTLARVCAQPAGNQGVVLVESVIHPDYLRDPAPSDVREGKCALMGDLKQELRRKLEEGRPCEKLLHVWEVGEHVNNRLIDLLGIELYEKELLSYRNSLQDASKMVQCRSEVGVFESGSSSTLVTDGLMKENTKMQVSDKMTKENLHSSCQDEEDAPFEVIVTKQLARLISQKMETVHVKLDAIQDQLRAIQGKLDLMHRNIMELRDDVLPEILTSVKQTLNFAIENERGKVPRFVFLTAEGVSAKRRMVTALLPDVTSVRIELFCEHRSGPHRVKEQKGLSVSMVKGGTFLEKALPYVQGFLKVLTVLLKVGAHVAAGAPQYAIPDFTKLIALALDTPGFLESEGLLARLDALCTERDFLGWEEWLLSQIKKKKGNDQVNTCIHELFGLRRALSKHQVAWLCDKHYERCSDEM